MDPIYTFLHTYHDFVYPTLSAIITAIVFNFLSIRYIRFITTKNLIFKLWETWELLIFEGIVAGIIYLLLFSKLLDITILGYSNIYIKAIFIGTISRTITHIPLPKSLGVKENKIDFSIFRTKLENNVKYLHYNQQGKYVRNIYDNLKDKSLDNIKSSLIQSIPEIKDDEEGKILLYEKPLVLLKWYLRTYGVAGLKNLS